MKKLVVILLVLCLLLSGCGANETAEERAFSREEKERALAYLSEFGGGEERIYSRDELERYLKVIVNDWRVHSILHITSDSDIKLYNLDSYSADSYEIRITVRAPYDIKIRAIKDLYWWFPDSLWNQIHFVKVVFSVT